MKNERGMHKMAISLHAEDHQPTISRLDRRPIFAQASLARDGTAKLDIGHKCYRTAQKRLPYRSKQFSPMRSPINFRCT